VYSLKTPKRPGDLAEPEDDGHALMTLARFDTREAAIAAAVQRGSGEVPMVVCDEQGRAVFTVG
jgi:hypothetical protein